MTILVLSNRMKEILFLLAQYNEGMTRNSIVHAIEIEKWTENTERSSCSSERILKDSVRVSYDRTLLKLRKLELVEAGFPKDLRPMSFYDGTKWRGFFYTLTEEGKKKANEIILEIFKPVNRLNQLILNVLEE